LKSKSALWVGAAAAVVAAAALAILLTRGDDAAPPPPQGPRVIQGLVAADAGFRFEVVDGACGYARVVTAEEAIPPENDEFCLIRFHVTNETDTDRTLDPSCQFMIDTSGKRHTQSDLLGLDPTSKEVFEQGVPSGQLVEDAALYYDVPKGTLADTVVLHGDCGSRGVQIRVEEPKDENAS
jgi:hypothetical protein